MIYTGIFMICVVPFNEGEIFNPAMMDKELVYFLGWVGKPPLKFHDWNKRKTYFPSSESPFPGADFQVNHVKL